MSGQIGVLSSCDTLLDKNDNRNLSMRWQELAFYLPDPVTSGSYANQFWPRSALWGDYTNDIGVLDYAPVWWEVPDLSRGGTSRWGFAGVTRDAFGSPVGGVTVKLFHTADDIKQDQQVSDASGNYFVTSSLYPDAHYIVTYKAGSPDIFGTSVNTKIGS